MRLAILIAALLPVSSSAQPAADQTSIAEAFSHFVSTVHSQELSGTAALVACPIDIGEERPVAGMCDMDWAAHRVRVEKIASLATILFPAEPSALDPQYAVEEESDGVFHLLLFSGLDSADYVLAAFTDVDGVYLLTNLDTEGGPESVPPPPSVIFALENMLNSAADEETTVDSFALLVVARGDDNEREWKEAADPSRPDERRFAEEVLQGVRVLMEASRGDYEILRYESEEESEGDWQVLHVRFDTHEIEQHVAFAFLPVGRDLLLGDIDG